MDPLPAGLSPLTAFLCLTVLVGVALRLYCRRWRDMQLVTVIDGDTYVALDAKGRRRRIRLYAADCPEMGQLHGPQAKYFVHRTVGKRWVKVQLQGRDRYRRHVARVVVEGQDLAVLLVDEGLAHPLTAHWRLKLAAWNARWHRKGVHSVGKSQKPWDWRAQHRWARLWKHLSGKSRRGSVSPRNGRPLR